MYVLVLEVDGYTDILSRHLLVDLAYLSTESLSPSRLCSRFLMEPYRLCRS